MTGAGRTLLRHASSALDEVDQAVRTVHNTVAGRAVVRVGLFPSAGAAFVPPLVASLRQDCPGITVTIHEGSTPSLLRSVRASTLDLAVIGSQPSHAPPGDEARAVVLETLVEGEVVVAVPSRCGIGADGTVTVTQLQECVWITGSSSSREPGFGAWPALLNRPAAPYHARDWLTKLTLVAHGLGVTTVPPYLGALVPDGVRLVRVIDGSPVIRRASLARLAGPSSEPLREVADHLWRVVRGAPPTYPTQRHQLGRTANAVSPFAAPEQSRGGHRSARARSGLPASGSTAPARWVSAELTDAHRRQVWLLDRRCIRRC